MRPRRWAACGWICGCLAFGVIAGPFGYAAPLAAQPTNRPPLARVQSLVHRDVRLRAPERSRLDSRWAWEVRTTAPRHLLRQDRWLGRDKWLHFAVSAALQFTAYGFLRSRGVSPSASHLGATAFTGAASVGKEWQDARSGGAFSKRDLVWDAVGALGASVAAHQIEGL